MNYEPINKQKTKKESENAATSPDSREFKIDVFFNFKIRNKCIKNLIITDDYVQKKVK